LPPPSQPQGMLQCIDAGTRAHHNTFARLRLAAFRPYHSTALSARPILASRTFRTFRPVETLARMALQAPAIIGIRSPASEAARGPWAWMQGIALRQVRIACGLVMFAYIFSHFFNHALGIVSYELMERWLWFHIWWWRIPIVNAALYAAAFVHL